MTNRHFALQQREQSLSSHNITPHCDLLWFSMLQDSLFASELEARLERLEDPAGADVDRRIEQLVAEITRRAEAEGRHDL